MLLKRGLEIGSANMIKLQCINAGNTVWLLFHNNIQPACPLHITVEALCLFMQKKKYSDI